MKKIPLSVEHFAGNLRAIAHFLLRSEDPHLFIPIMAIVDTGSPLTLIGPLDLKKMRLSKIQIQKIEGKLNPINVGGGEVSTKILEKTKLKFSNTNVEIEMPVHFPLRGEENPTQPSLLGVDFMLKTKAKLYFNPSRKEAYFEIED